MNRIERAVSDFRDGCLCSQAVFAAFSEDLGLDRERALKIAAAFGGGMGMAQTCGAVTGALMVIGLKHGDDRAKAGPVAAEFREKFASRAGSVVCKDLLDCDISTPEGAAAAREKELYTSVCPKMVQHAAEILEEIL